MKAIVYTSQTGSAAEYAGLLGKAVGLPVYTVSEAKRHWLQATKFSI